METVWLCVLERCADSRMFYSISLTSRAGANACRRIRDIVSVTDRFVVTEKMHGGCQTFLRSSGLLHGAFDGVRPDGRRVVTYFKYGKQVS
jgi:hypothetical protein